MKLSPEDAASAMKQHICPVSGGMLGAMGATTKVDVNGQQVWICCESCRDPLLENPDEYLTKCSWDGRTFWKTKRAVKFQVKR